MQKNQEYIYQHISNPKGRESLGADITNELVHCITSAFGHEMPEDEVDSALEAYLMVIARTVGGDVAGFTTLDQETVASFRYGKLDYPPETILYSLGAGTVDFRFHGQGVYRELTKQRLAPVIAEQAPLLKTTTQNPKVEKGVKAVLDDYIIAGSLKSYSLQRYLLPTRYGRRLTKEPLQTAGTAFEKLNIEAGDAFSLVFELKYDN